MTDKSAAQSFPDFWRFLQECEARLNEEAASIKSDAEMEALVSKWLNPIDGVLERMKDDPFFALAKPSARNIFMNVMKNRVQQAQREWEQVWRSVHESGS